MTARLRFIVDESTGSAVAEYLQQAGYDVLFAGDIMAQADDSDILALAVHQQRIVVTNDKDFGELVFHTGQVHDGVLLLRLEDESPANRLRVFQAVLVDHGDRLPGNFVVATEKGIRVRTSRTIE
jgi:predicted nuclease of predicted toxin-antitoxin system